MLPVVRGFVVEQLDDFPARRLVVGRVAAMDESSRAGAKARDADSLLNLVCDCFEAAPGDSVGAGDCDCFEAVLALGGVGG
eukprot:14332860-Alexandrium_andersonii.AAC.1